MIFNSAGAMSITCDGPKSWRDKSLRENEFIALGLAHAAFFPGKLSGSRTDLCRILWSLPAPFGAENGQLQELRFVSRRKPDFMIRGRQGSPNQPARVNVRFPPQAVG